MAKTETGGAAGAGKETTRKKKTFKKRGEKRVVHHGFVHIQASFNNTLITITDAEGTVVSWSSAGAIGFKGSRKGTPFAATQAALTADQRRQDVRHALVRRAGEGARAPAASRRSARCRRRASR